MSCFQAVAALVVPFEAVTRGGFLICVVRSRRASSCRCLGFSDSPRSSTSLGMEAAVAVKGARHSNAPTNSELTEGMVVPLFRVSVVDGVGIAGKCASECFKIGRLKTEEGFARKEEKRELAPVFQFEALTQTQFAMLPSMAWHACWTTARWRSNQHRWHDMHASRDFRFGEGVAGAGATG